jgi:predicted enzyme related to lactoylglutathione lyase
MQVRSNSSKHRCTSIAICLVSRLCTIRIMEVMTAGYLATMPLSWGGGAYLHFALYQTKGSVTRNVQIGFPVDDLAATHARLRAAGVPISHEPRDEPWGKTARYCDPDGNSVSLTERHPR